MRVNSYSTVGVVEQKDMVNSGAGDRKKRNLRLEVYSNYNNSLSHASTRIPGNLLCWYSVASARRSRFLGPLRTRAGSTVHYAIQEQV